VSTGAEPRARILWAPCPFGTAHGGAPAGPRIPAAGRFHRHSGRFSGPPYSGPVKSGLVKAGRWPGEPPSAGLV
jgi:hypothetical protein